MIKIILLAIALSIMPTISDAKPKLMKKVTKAIINQADQDVKDVEIIRIIPEEDTVICRLFYKKDGGIEEKRVYRYKGATKNAIFDDLETDEIAYLEGTAPTNQWDIKLIRLYMDDKQSPDEDGNVSVDDPYYYTQNMTVEELLAKIDSAENNVDGN